MNDRPTVGPAVTARAAAVVIDVNDLTRQARFWGGLLGVDVDVGRERTWVDVAPLGGRGPMLSLQLVVEVKERKNRVHLDLEVADFVAARQRVLDLGAVPASVLHHTGRPWQAFSDPEGNEFCLITG